MKLLAFDHACYNCVKSNIRSDAYLDRAQRVKKRGSGQNARREFGDAACSDERLSKTFKELQSKAW
jgi:hypothetical protein